MRTSVTVGVFLLFLCLFLCAQAQGQGVSGSDGTTVQPPFHDDPQQALADAKGRGCCVVLCIAERG